MNILKNQDGFSLLQVIIACALFSGLAIYSAKTFNVQKKQIVYTGQRFDEEVITGQINHILRFEKSCTKTFEGQDLRSYGGAEFIVFMAGSERELFQKDEKYGQNGITISKYELSDKSNFLKKSFGNSTNVASSTIKHSVLKIIFERSVREDKKGNKIHKGFGATKKVVTIPLIIVTDANSFIVKTCRAASGNNSLWSRSVADKNDIYYKDGVVAIGAEPVSGGKQLQVTGDVVVEGNIEIQNNANIDSVEVNKELILPKGAPPSIKDGMIWFN